MAYDLWNDCFDGFTPRSMFDESQANSIDFDLQVIRLLQNVAPVIFLIA